MLEPLLAFFYLVGVAPCGFRFSPERLSQLCTFGHACAQSCIPTIMNRDLRTRTTLDVLIIQCSVSFFRCFLSQCHLFRLLTIDAFVSSSLPANVSKDDETVSVGQLTRSFSTLENWADIVRQVGAQSYVAWPVFSTFVVITAFILYSLIIAVVCDAVASDNEDEDKMSDSEVRAMIQENYRKIELLTREQIQIQSLCQTCKMYAEKRNQMSMRPLVRRRSWLSFLFKTVSKQSLMSDGGQISRRSMPRYDDDSVSSNDSSAYLCLAVEGVRKLRDFCGTMVNHPRVQACIVVLIAINAFMMGLATFDFVSDSPQASFAFDVIDMLFLILFTVEIGLQVVYHGLWTVLTDGWMCFDFLVVVGSWAMGDLQIIRSFRIFRAFRLVARLDTLKNLVQALIDVAPSVGGILALLALIMYIFAVMCTVLLDDLYPAGIIDEDYFGRLDYTFFSKLRCELIQQVF